MNLFRTLSGAALVCLSAAGFTSCISAPDYPDEPEIDFKELTVGRNRPGGGNLPVDTLKFALDFKDGDGDLGLSDDDIRNAPFNSNTGGPNNRGYSYNYFIQPFKKNPTSGVFERFVTPLGFVGEYDGRFLRLDGTNTTDAKPAPLRGTLRYKLPISIDGNSQFPGVFNIGDTFRFEISIMDRALHQSNKITTSEVTLGR
ncbi:hypothetical protein GCM10027511_42110 [Hymenobacter humi]